MTARDHLDQGALDRYAAGGASLGADAVWAVEAHLESCTACRNLLREAVSRRDPGLMTLLATVQATVTTELSNVRQMPRRKLPRVTGRWAAPGLLQRLAMTAVVLGSALALELLGSTRVPQSLVLLVAPVAPLLAVAGVWSAGPDPAHELVVASPRAGLDLVLRRTLAVLGAVIPAAALAGWLVGTPAALWLLPCLTFTAGALSLGEHIGLHRACGALTLAWLAGVIAPSVLTSRIPVVLQPSSLPYWAGALSVIGAALLLRRRAYTGLEGQTWSVR